MVTSVAEGRSTPGNSGSRKAVAEDGQIAGCFRPAPLRGLPCTAPPVSPTDIGPVEGRHRRRRCPSFSRVAARTRLRRGMRPGQGEAAGRLARARGPRNPALSAHLIVHRGQLEVVSLMSIPMLQKTSNLPGSIQVIMHGGEPLLAAPDSMRYAVRTIRDALYPAVYGDFRHTGRRAARRRLLEAL